MLTKATIINWILTVIIGSMIFSAIQQEPGDLEEWFSFGMISMAVSAVLGGSTFIVLVTLINVWIRRQPKLGKRLMLVHLVHLACAVVTFAAMYATSSGRDDNELIGRVIISYGSTAAVIWLISSLKMLKRELVAEPVELASEV